MLVSGSLKLFSFDFLKFCGHVQVVHRDEGGVSKEMFKLADVTLTVRDFNREWQPYF